VEPIARHTKVHQIGKLIGSRGGVSVCYNKQISRLEIMLEGGGTTVPFNPVSSTWTPFNPVTLGRQGTFQTRGTAGQRVQKCFKVDCHVKYNCTSKI
jgi:hypothetical protein